MLSWKVFNSGVTSQTTAAVCNDTATGLTATGTGQSDAYALTYAYNSFSTVAAGTGALLYGNAISGDSQLVYNGGANALLVYPESGGNINSLAANAAFSVAAGATHIFWRDGSAHWIVEAWGNDGDAVQLTDAATITCDISTGSVFDVTLGGNRTITFTGGSSAIDGHRFIVRFKQDATGGRTITYDSTAEFGSDFSSITLTTTPAKTDHVGFVYKNSGTVCCIVAYARGYT